MQAIETTSTDGAREARRAGELIGTAIDVLREEIADGGALSRAVERLGRVSRGLAFEHAAESPGATLAATHHALAHVLAIGGAVRGALSDRGSQCMETLAAAQHILYPVARAHGVSGPPPLQRREAERASTAPSGIERRAAPRVELGVEVGFESESNFYTGFSEDVSDGGLFVATYRLAPIGTRMELEFTLPNGHVVHTNAEVRWLRDPRDDDADARPGMGLAFDALLPEDARAIREFVRARAPLFYDD